jgi:hypothetical protein
MCARQSYIDIHSLLVTERMPVDIDIREEVNPLNAELNPICHFLVLLGALTFMVPCIVSIFQYISNKTFCKILQSISQSVVYHTFISTRFHVSSHLSGTDSSVSIATGYGLDGPGIESRWRRDFSHLSKPALGPTQPPVQRVPGLFRGVKSGRGVTLTPHPLLVPLVMKE